MPLASLIITADDYGMSPQFNAGVLDAARDGLVTGISVMIKRKYIRAKELLGLGIPLGLHLELEVASSYREIVTQIEHFKKRFGQLPAYLDGHQHKHVTPKNLGHAIRAAKYYHLPVRSHLPIDRARLKQIGVTTPDNFISWHPDRLPILADRLRTAKHLPVSELVVHPGYQDKRCRYRYNDERERELAFLRSPQFRRLIKPFRLVRYTELSNAALHVRTYSPRHNGGIRSNQTSAR